jgi:hypothetical protein
METKAWMKKSLTVMDKHANMFLIIPKWSLPVVLSTKDAFGSTTNNVNQRLVNQ